MMAMLPTSKDVRDAARRLPNTLCWTPCIEAVWLSGPEQGRVWLKIETLQPTHSFKVRGATNAVLALLETRHPVELVTASAGNHGAALAWAAHQHQVPLTVFTPRSAPATKLEKIAASGATLRADAASYDEAEAMALAFARTRGVRYVSPYNDPLVIAGAGTIGLEIAAQVPSVAEVVVPVGGGGLISGIALAMRDAVPQCRLTGAEAEASPAFTTALAANAITPFAVRDTIADGLGGNLEAGSITFDLVRDLVDRIVTVDELRLRSAIVRLLEHEHLISEGAGAIALASYEQERENREREAPRGDTVIVITGSNIDMARLRELMNA